MKKNVSKNDSKKMKDDMEHVRRIPFQSRHLGDNDGQCEEETAHSG